MARPFRWQLALFALLFSATLLNYSQRFVFTQNTSKIQKAFVDETRSGAEVDRNVAAYGHAAARFSLGFALGSLVFGVLADLISVRWLYPIVVVAWSLAGLTSGLAESVGGLAVSRFLLGLFEAGQWPCALRTTQRTFAPAARSGANSILQSGASIGAVLTPLLVLAIHQQDPTAWRQSFFLVSGLGLPWAVLWLCVVKESDLAKPVIQTDETSLGVGTSQTLVERPLLQIFFSRRWLVLLFTVICINTVWHFIRVWMTDWLENHHGYSHAFTNQFTSVYFLSTFLGSIASGSLIGFLAKRNWNVHRARLATFLIFSCLTALVVPAAFLPKGPLLLGLLLVVAFGSLGLFPIYYSLNQELSAKHQGKVGGSLGFSTWLTLSFFHSWVSGIIESAPERRTAIFCVVGLAPLVAYVVLRFGWGTRQDASPPNAVT